MAHDFNRKGEIESSLESGTRALLYVNISITQDRKKEQNKLASRRFRQRRKMEQTNCEREAQLLENSNKLLKEKCEEMESKIRLLKDLMNRTKDNPLQLGDKLPLMR